MGHHPIGGHQPYFERINRTIMVIPHSQLTDLDVHLFREGRHLRLFEKLGSFPVTLDGLSGTYFAVWAPGVEEVSVISDHNYWTPGSDCLLPRGDESGIWEGFIPGFGVDTAYKYGIRKSFGGIVLEKGDPMARLWESPPRTASVSYQDRYAWNDSDWMKSRAGRHTFNSPMSVYEVHLGSWRRNPEQGSRSLFYSELALELTEYVRDMGYTHVELMPVMEHPFFGSWGYQITGYYAPSSRFGSPADFKHLIDQLHQAGIGVILDWVPSHFPADAHGLAAFTGDRLYEYPDPRKGYQPDWNSLIFDYGRPEVRSFLLSNALFWLEEFHADGLRVDAVSSMLYLDYSRSEGQWLPNRYGGNEHLEAVSFLRELNTEVYGRVEGVHMIAEESTSWPAVTKPVDHGGLGFGFKWMMGWMHDTLSYFKENPLYRSYHQDKLTFGLMYAFSEQFVLALSHDEVVHGKGSLLGKMPGDPWQMFANLRLLFGFQFAHPGAKLHFMGAEMGQISEWNHDSSLPWHLLNESPNRGIQTLMRRLNALYRTEPALYAYQCDARGFQWVDGNDRTQSVLIFLRRDQSDVPIVVVGHFIPSVVEGYRIGVPVEGVYEEILNTDHPEFGGSGVLNAQELRSEPIPYQGMPYSLMLTLPPLGIVYLKPKSLEPNKKPTGAAKVVRKSRASRLPAKESGGGLGEKAVSAKTTNRKKKEE
ncbi:MAG: 1,4-alpha-glucan branching protein GlgB [Bacteroidia bacterium]